MAGEPRNCGKKQSLNARTPCRYMDLRNHGRAVPPDIPSALCSICAHYSTPCEWIYCTRGRVPGRSAPRRGRGYCIGALLYEFYPHKLRHQSAPNQLGRNLETELSSGGGWAPPSPAAGSGSGSGLRPGSGFSAVRPPGGARAMPRAEGARRRRPSSCRTSVSWKTC